MPPPPDPVEWDFENVPDSELEACALWEYARESAWMRDLKQRCEDPVFWTMSNLPAHEFVGKDIERVQSSWEASHVLCHGLFTGNPGPDLDSEGNHKPVPLSRPALCFPCPWQYLPLPERERRGNIPSVRDEHRFVPFQRGHWGTARWLVEYGEASVGKVQPDIPGRPGWRPGQSILFAGAEMGIFEIGWDFYTNDEICKAFAKWVSENRPPEQPAPSSQGKRDYDSRVALRRLGMMRLLHRCPLTEMPQWCPAAWKLYEKANWFKERQRAGVTFNKLLYFLPSWEIPRSSPTAASGGGV